MIPDALKPAICDNCDGLGERFYGTCDECGGLGINPDMIRETIIVSHELGAPTDVVFVEDPGRYVVIPLSGGSNE